MVPPWALDEVKSELLRARCQTSPAHQVNVSAASFSGPRFSKKIFDRTKLSLDKSFSQ
jgi:hypothetical protein